MPSVITLWRVLPEFYEYDRELYFDLYRTSITTAVLPCMHMYRFQVVIGYVGGGRCCDSCACGAVDCSGIPSGTTRQ